MMVMDDEKENEWKETNTQRKMMPVFWYSPTSSWWTYTI